MIVEEKKRKGSRFGWLSFRSLGSKMSRYLYTNYQKYPLIATSSRLVKSVRKYRIASLLSHAALPAKRVASKREDYSPEVARLQLDYNLVKIYLNIGKVDYNLSGTTRGPKVLRW